MTKFVKVDQAPETLDRELYVVKAPTFLDEVLLCEKKKPKNNQITSNYLREILAAVVARYAEKDINVITEIDVGRFRGVQFKSPEDVDAIVKKAIYHNHKFLIDSYVHYHLKKRPAGTKLVYFLGSHLESGAFTRNGIDEIKLKDVDSYLGKKPKKVVGKPALSNDEIESNV